MKFEILLKIILEISAREIILVQCNHIFFIFSTTFVWTEFDEFVTYLIIVQAFERFIYVYSLFFTVLITQLCHNIIINKDFFY